MNETSSVRDPNGKPVGDDKTSFARPSAAEPDRTLDPRPPVDLSQLTMPPLRDGTCAIDDQATNVLPPSVAVNVPGYEVLRELGRGGMGVVYQARHIKLNRLVALKMILSASHAGTAELARFRTEAESLARLQHPNIVQVFEVSEHDGMPFFSLEFCAGGSLDRKLKGTPLAPREAAQLLETLAQAMHAAHQARVIHRDLKPANVLLSSKSETRNLKTATAPDADFGFRISDFEPKITDFGLAKQLDDTSGQTQSGAVMGTPSYMSPEQASGRSKELGPAADIYALGAILYECLTGRPPFKAATPLETVMQVAIDEPVPPSRLNPKTPRDLETICLKCLHKEPGKRYATAEALAEDLARFREDRPIVARPVSRVEHAWRWCRRNPVVAALSAAAVAGVFVAALLLNQERLRTLQNLTRAVEAERDLTSQLDRTAQAERERTEQLWKSYRDEAEARRFSRQVGQRFESLKALTEAARIARSLGKDEEVFQDLRRKAIVSLCLPDLRLEKELPGWTKETIGYAIDGKFERYALHYKSGSISVRQVADGREILPLPGSNAGQALGVFEFSPDGRYLAAYAGVQLKIWDLDRGQPAAPFEPGILAGLLNFSPDNRRVVVVYKNGGFGVYDLTTGMLERRWQGSAAGCRQVVFHPDSRRFAALFSGTALIQIWSADTGRLLGNITQVGQVGNGSWSADGRLLAVADDGDPRIHLWDVASKRQVGLLEGHKNLGIGVHFNPAGDLVASSGWECMLRLWDPRTGRQLLSTPSWDHRFNRAGDHMLLRPKGPQIWELAEGREYRTFVGDPVRGKMVPYGGSISPDGRFFAVGSDDGTVIWEMATGNELAHLRTGKTWDVLFQPSGDLLTSSVNTGLMRWPVRPNLDVDGEYRIGPPEALVPGGTDGVAQSKDGRTVVVAVSGAGGRIVDLDHPSILKPLLPHPGVNKSSISPDGQWAATGCHHGTGIKVWSVRQNQLVCTLPIEGGATPLFSPDGRWLATNSADGLQLWKVGTWERGPHLTDGSPVFLPDSPLVGVCSGPVITLVDPDSGRTVAVLEDPNQDRVGAVFSSDGSQLVTMTIDSHSVHVWDLRRIRAELKAINLDWEAPDYPPAPAPHPPLRIKVLGNPTPALIVLTTPKPGNRRATPAQLAGWIKQLADPDAAKRSEAARALEEVGVPAMKVLEEAAGHTDAAVRQRVQQVRDRIAVAEALTPHRVGLTLKDVPVADAVKALAQQAGVGLLYFRKDADGPPKTVTLELDGVPYLEALDRLCQIAGLSATPNGAEGWILRDGTSVSGELLAYAGPLRIQAANVEFTRRLELQEKNQSSEKLGVSLTVKSEARAAVLAVGRVRVLEASDDAGHSLLFDPQLKVLPDNDVFIPTAQAQVATPAVLLQAPPVRGGKLQHLKLVLPVEIMARRRTC